MGPTGAVVVLDGRLVAPDEARISVFDRGFLFGDAVFEVLRTYGGVPFALEAHLDRLSQSMAMLGIVATFPSLRAEIEDAIESARALGEGDHYLRIIVTRGEGPLHLDPTPATKPSRVVICAPLLPLPEAIERGVSMATVHAHRAADATHASAAKVTAYVGNLLAYVEARHRGAYEALLVTDSGEILEGHSSSFFIVRDGVIETPPLASGILPGITRALVIELAKDLGIPCCEVVLTPSRVYAAAEAFLTSSLREIVPVVSIDGVRIGDGEAGPITRQLREAYRARRRI